MKAAAAGFALLLAWDASGLDLRIARWFGNAGGFALRDSWWASTLLHDGGRHLAWAVLAALAVCAWRAPARSTTVPSRRRRWYWLGAMLLCAVAVPAIKRVSTTSCPWHLAEFGGIASHVSHWQFGVADGGSGHCFPSGHAVAAFAFFGMFFLWRPFSPARARSWLLGTALAGAAFGTAQLVRGAHYPSHTLWSAWICWTLCSGADWLTGAAVKHRGCASRWRSRWRLTFDMCAQRGLPQRVTALPLQPPCATGRRRTPPLRRGRRGRA